MGRTVFRKGREGKEGPEGYEGIHLSTSNLCIYVPLNSILIFAVIAKKSFATLNYKKIICQKPYETLYIKSIANFPLADRVSQNGSVSNEEIINKLI